MNSTLKNCICSFVLFCVLTPSFSKSHTNSTSSEEIVLLKKLTSKVLGNENVYSFTYDNNKLAKITFTTFNGSTQKGYFKFIYEGTLIAKIQEYNNSNKLIYTSTFTYANGKLSNVVKQEMGKNKAEKISFTYNANGSITSERRLGASSQQNQLVDTEYLYFNENRLIKKVEAGVVSSATIFEYDRANHPLQHVVGMDKINAYLNSSFGMFSSSGLEGIQNNREKQTVYTPNGVIDYVLVFKISYSDKNFPTNKMSPPDSPGAFEYSYLYY